MGYPESFDELERWWDTLRLVSDGDAVIHAIEDRIGSESDPKQRQILLRFLLFGFICSSKLPLTRCHIETELESLLRSFPPDQSVILKELRALGATCRGDDRRLACVVERTVETTGWAAGHEPRVIESRILIGLLVEDVNGSLHYSASYDMAEQQKSNDQ